SKSGGETMTAVSATSRAPAQPTTRNTGSTASRTVGSAFASIDAIANASSAANSAPVASAPRLPTNSSETMALPSTSAPARSARPPNAMPLSAELLPQRRHELGDRDADLRHRVALADRDLTVLERAEVHRHAERRADLVLPAVATADGLRLVVRAHELGTDRSG